MDIGRGANSTLRVLLRVVMGGGEMGSRFVGNMLGGQLGNQFAGGIGMLAGGMMALPLLLMLGFLAVVALVLLVIVIFAAISSVIGNALTVLLFLGALFAVGRRVYRIFLYRITQAFIASQVPYLQAYMNVSVRYDPDTLPEEAREFVTPYLDTYAAMLRASVDDATLAACKLSRDSSSRDLVAVLPLTASLFAGYSREEFVEIMPPLCDLEAHDALLRDVQEKELRKRGDTVIGSQFSLSVPLIHERRDHLVAVSESDRFRHSYLLGKTGAGKTTTLIWLIAQDLERDGRGVVVISPEDGIFESILPRIPEHRRDDLIYFEPTDTRPVDPDGVPQVIGFNPFAFFVPEGTPAHEREAMLTQQAGEVYTVFERALGDLGVKMVTLFQNVAYALLQTPGATILDIDRLLDPNDSSLREQLLADSQVDDRTKRFWRQYETSNYYKSAYEPVVNRLEPFFRPPLAQVLSAPATWLTEALCGSRPRIIFVNLSKLRGEQAALLGQLMIASVQQTLLRRDSMPVDQRTGYQMYVDEFALFVTSEQSFIDLFERARKYRMGVTLAHQVLADLSSKLRDILVGNVGTMIVMELSAHDAPYFAKELQLMEANTVRREQVAERELARIARDEERMARTTGRQVDMLSDPYDVLKLQQKVRSYAGGTISPEIIQNLPQGKAIVRMPKYKYGMPVEIPYLPNAPDAGEIGAAMILNSKRLYGHAQAVETDNDFAAPAATQGTEGAIPSPVVVPKKRFAVSFD